MKLLNIYAVVVIAVVGLSGCASQIDDLQEFVSTAKTQPKLPIKPLPPIPDYNPIPYEGLSLADPFFPRRMIVGEAGGSKAGTPPPPDANRPKEFLESVALDQLKMVGFFFNAQKRPVALIQVPDKKIYMVGTGQHMGMNYGKVVKLDEDGVLIKEQVYELGQWQGRDVKIEPVVK